MPITANEATLVGALGAAAVSAIVSLGVALYVVKKSPDYEKQLGDLRNEMARVSAAQEGMLAHQKLIAAEEQTRRDAQNWRPGKAYFKSDLAQRTNTLILVGDRHFSIEQMDIATRTGAVVASIPSSLPIGTMAKGMNVTIPETSILALVVPDMDYRSNSQTAGKLLYVLSVGVGRERMAFELPFRAIQEITNNTAWTRLEG